MEDVPLVFEGRGLTVTERLAGFFFGENMSFVRHTDGESLSLVPTTDHVGITITVCHAFMVNARNGVRCETLVWFFGVCDASSCKRQKRHRRYFLLLNILCICTLIFITHTYFLGIFHDSEIGFLMNFVIIYIFSLDVSKPLNH